jgi:hypothetical protein
MSTTFATGFKAITDFIEPITDFAKSFDLNGAITSSIQNAVVTKIAGGDVGKAASLGFIGGGIAGIEGTDSIFGKFAEEVGFGLQGFGLAEANGQNGLLGAAGGALYGYMNDSQSDRANADYLAREGGPQQPTNREQEIGMFDKGGLLGKGGAFMAEDGKSTFLGDLGLGVVSGLAQEKLQEKGLKQQAELIQKSKRQTKELDEEFDQNRISALRNL